MDQNGAAEPPKAKQIDGKLTPYLITFVSLAAFTGAFQFGWSLAILNTSESAFLDFFATVYRMQNQGAPMAAEDLRATWSITVALLSVGGLIGGLSSGTLADKIGRKNALVFTNVLVIVSTLMATSSPQIIQFYTITASRFVSGLFVGLFSGITPLYLTEIAPVNLRGAIGTVNQLFCTIGILVANIMGLSSVFGSMRFLNLLISLTMVPAVMGYFLLIGPESPKHLYMNLGKREEAREALIKLRGSDREALELVEQELQALETQQQQKEQSKEAKFTDLFRKKILVRPVFVVVGLMMFQQLSGINGIISYSTKLFKDVGLSNQAAELGTVAMGGAQVVTTVLCTFLIEKAGRKILLLAGFAGMCFSSFGIAIASIVTEYGGPNWFNYFTIVFAVLYLISFSLGPGAIPWILASEMFDSESIGKASSLAVGTNWLCSFIVTVTYSYIQEALGVFTWLIFGTELVLGCAFVFFFIPETKGKTVEQNIANFAHKFIFRDFN